MYDYDKIPYESLPFAETHPERLAVLGRLFTLSVADPRQCRVLELGCASGGNLIPMAWYLRDCEFVGIELEPSQVAAGQQLCADLGLTNIRIQQGDIQQIGEELGQFDYIIAHGVYSWVPEPVRDALLALCRRLLNPNGLAYISYNVRPGWNARGMLREMFVFHLQGISEPQQRLAACMEYLDVLIGSLSAQPTTLAKHLLQEATYLKASHPSYVYHDFLEENCFAVSVADFLAHAKQHGLRYLCESQLYTMFASTLGKGADAFLDGVSDPVRQEQYLDFLSLRAFRQTILCREEQQPDYNIELERLDDFAVYSALKPPAKLDVRRDKAQPFTSPAGKEFSVSQPLTKLLLAHAHAAYPGAVSLPMAAASARQHLEQQGATRETLSNESWRGELFNLFVNGSVQLSLAERHFNAGPMARPHANALAQAQARQGQNLTTVWHESLAADDFARRLVTYLDGSRDGDGLTDAMLQDIATGTLVLPQAVRDSKALRRQVALNVDHFLALFARNGLLAAQASADKPRAEGGVGKNVDKDDRSR